MVTTSFRLTATYRIVEHGWVQASIVELPGVLTAAPTRAEAEEMLLDALREYLLALGDLERELRQGEGATPSPDGEEERPVAITFAAE